MSYGIIRYAKQHLSTFPSTLFRELKIGIESYRDYLLTELTAVNSVISDALASGVEQRNTPAGSIAVSVPIQGGDFIAIGQVLSSSIADCINGYADEITVNLKKATGEYEAIVMDYEVCQGLISDKITELQGSIALLDSALTSGFNESFDLSTVVSALQSRGWSTSSFISNVSSMLGRGSKWIDVLTAVFAADTKKQSDSGYEYTFNASAYSSSSSFALGLNSILGDVTDFFEDIELNWSTLREFFASVWNAIAGAIGSLIRYLVPNVGVDYDLVSDAPLEGFDIPFIRAQYSFADHSPSDIVSQAINIAVNRNLYNETMYSSPFQFKGSAAQFINDADRGMTVFGNLIPDCVGLESVLKDFVPVGHSVTVPTGFGYYLINRSSADVLDIYGFFGSFEYSRVIASCPLNVNWYTNEWVLTTRPLNPYERNAFRRLSVPGSNASNQDFCASLTRIESAGSPQRFANTFFGGTISGLLSYNDVELNQPDSWVDRWSSNLSLSNDDLSIVVSASVLCTLACLCSDKASLSFTNLSTGVVTANGVPTELPTESAKLKLLDGDHFHCYYPYQRDIAPSFTIHAQTDSERTNEVRTLVRNIALSALAVGVTATAAKLTKRARVKSLELQVNRRKESTRIFEKAMSGESISYNDWKSLKSIDRKIKALSLFGDVVLGNTAERLITKSLSSNGDQHRDVDLTEITYLISGRP